MPFISRVTEVPPLSQIQEIEQIVIVDQTGPSLTLGASSGATCIVGEFLKGPFIPTEVYSAGDLQNKFTGYPSYMDRISQAAATAAAVQDGTGVAFDGNGFVELKGKKFNRLIVQRVDTDMVTTSGGTTKCIVNFEVTVAAADQTDGVTNKDILIPAGIRFGDTALLSSATGVVALSQDILIPAGTTVTSNTIVVDEAFENENGTVGATAFFVKGITLASAALDSALDSEIPGFESTIASTGVSATTVGGSATAIFAPGTGAAVTLAAKMVTLYEAAIDKTQPTEAPQEDITEIFSARNYNMGAGSIATTIRAPLWANAVDSSNAGARGRIAIVSGVPSASASSSDAAEAITAVLALQLEFAGTNGDRVSINFPYVKIYSSELAQNILVSPGGFKASMFNTIPQEYQSSVGPSYNSVLQSIQGYEDAFVANPLVRGNYVTFKASGVSALRKDRSQGWQFQSAVLATNATSYSTRVFDNRRRFADFVQETLADISGKYNKLPATTERVDALVGEMEVFLSGLKAEDNPAFQRIEDYSIDPTSQNTPTLTALGIRTIEVCVRMLGDLNYIVLLTQVGPTVEV